MYHVYEMNMMQYNDNNSENMVKSHMNKYLQWPNWGSEHAKMYTSKI